jgi:hypothetical protein
MKLSHTRLWIYPRVSVASEGHADLHVAGNDVFDDLPKALRRIGLG